MTETTAATIATAIIASLIQNELSDFSTQAPDESIPIMVCCIIFIIPSPKFANKLVIGSSNTSPSIACAGFPIKNCINNNINMTNTIFCHTFLFVKIFMLFKPPF